MSKNFNILWAKALSASTANRCVFYMHLCDQYSAVLYARYAAVTRAIPMMTPITPLHSSSVVKSIPSTEHHASTPPATPTVSASFLIILHFFFLLMNCLILMFLPLCCLLFLCALRYECGKILYDTVYLFLCFVFISTVVKMTSACSVFVSLYNQFHLPFFNRYNFYRFIFLSVCTTGCTCCVVP